MIKESENMERKGNYQPAVIRSIRPTDNLDAIRSLSTRALQDINTGFVEEADEMHQDFLDPQAFYTARNGDFLVAEKEGKIVGFAAFMNYFEPTDIPTCYFRRLRVDPEFQNQGIGQQLIQERERLAKLHGYQAARAITTNKNQAAFHLLEKNGFRIIKETPAPHLGLGDDCVEYLLEKQLATQE